MFFKTLLISIFSDVCKIQALIPPLAAIQFQKIMLIIPFFGVVFNLRLRANIQTTVMTSHGKALLFLFIWMVLSVPLSVFPGDSFRFLTEHYWKLLVSVCLIVAYGSSIKALDKMVWALIFAVSIFAVSAFRYGGLNRFSLIEAYDPNENALLFVLSIPFVFWKMMVLKGLKKLLMAVAIFLMVVGIIETGSRGGFLGLVAIAITIIIQYRRVENVSLAKLLIIPALLSMTIYFMGGNEYIERIASISDTEGNYNYTSDSGRIAIWKQGLDMMVRNPLLGVGVNQFMTAQGLIYGGKWQASHNFFVQVGAELGFPGLIALCFIIFGTLKKIQSIAAFQAVSSGKIAPIITMPYSLVGSLIGFIVCGSFLSVAYTNIFYLLIALSLAYIKIATSNQEEI